ncbi:MAG: 4-(cytidine 5'-diphospho)-2-C-methyl-D-erythritol kinase [Deltaproteobacteria bacterium]|nr:MAG: 4-(cytidine 5'-diphospho)-2-C-methyl-D-erythritol kinase [Deltaproteobacteria bacterium]
MYSRWFLMRDKGEGRVKVWAPAKINLFLKVVRRLTSGYHEIESLMVPITLADEVELVLERSQTWPVEIHCDDPAIPTDSDNLVFKAVMALHDSGYPVGPISISIRKRIPSGAGLGGGSSDAAAVLKGIDYLLGFDLPPEKLRAVGLKVGADVPFFFMEQACLVSGIGERLKPLEISRDIWFLIGFPGFNISTKEAYNALDLELTNPKAQVNMPFSLEGETCQGGGVWQLFNDLETPVFVWYPSLEEFCKKLKVLGALEAKMTGSGSSIFGIFGERGVATAAMSEIQGYFPEWKLFLARPIWQSIDESWRNANGSDRGEGFSR